MVSFLLCTESVAPADFKSAGIDPLRAVLALIIAFLCWNGWGC